MPRVAAQRPGGYHLALIHSVFGPNSPVAMGRLAKSEGPASHVIPDGPRLLRNGAGSNGRRSMTTKQLIPS